MKPSKIDTRDGQAVATISSRAGFYPFLAKHKRPAHNFTVLYLQWLYHLSRAKHYDDRNKASVFHAIEVIRQMGIHEDYDFTGHIQHTAKIDDPQIAVTNYCDDNEISRMVKLYASDNNLTNGFYEDFIKRMLNEHRTLQQSFTRFCHDWCRYVVAKKLFGENTKTMKLAKELSKMDFSPMMI